MRYRPKKGHCKVRIKHGILRKYAHFAPTSMLYAKNEGNKQSMGDEAGICLEKMLLTVSLCGDNLVFFFIHLES